MHAVVDRKESSKWPPLLHLHTSFRAQFDKLLLPPPPLSLPMLRFSLSRRCCGGAADARRIQLKMVVCSKNNGKTARECVGLCVSRDDNSRRTGNRPRPKRAERSAKLNESDFGRLRRQANPAPIKVNQTRGEIVSEAGIARKSVTSRNRPRRVASGEVFCHFAVFHYRSILFGERRVNPSDGFSIRMRIEWRLLRCTFLFTSFSIG